MVLRSKFNKGNVVVAYDNVSRGERELLVANIKKWEVFNGFTYAFRDLDSNVPLYEEYDDLDFETQFEIRQVFTDVIDFKKATK